MVQYNGLLTKLNERGLTKSALTKTLGISSRTIAKISRGEKIADNVLKRIAVFLDCAPEELYEFVSDNPLLQRLREEKKLNCRAGYIMSFRFV